MNVEVVLNADGFGPVEDKTTKYGLLVAEEPIQYGGFKVFILPGPRVALVGASPTTRPVPVVINYQ